MIWDIVIIMVLKVVWMVLNCNLNKMDQIFAYLINHNNEDSYVGCLDCMENCLKCTSQYNCGQCKKGFFYDYSFSKCIQCNSVNCDQCYDLNTCLTCSKGYLIENGQCVQKSQMQQINSEQQQQSHQQENLQTNQVATENYCDQIQTKIDLEKQYQQTNIQEQVTKLNIDNQSNLVLQSKDSKINIDVLGGNNRPQNIQEEQLNEQQGQSNLGQTKSYADKNNQKEQENKFMMQNNLLKFLCFHNFISIFLVFDSKIPRMQRSSIFYLRVIHALSISSIFGQYYSSREMVLTCFVSSIIVAIFIPIAKLMYSIKRVGQYIYIGVFLGLLTYYIYIISFILTGKESSYTNYIIGWFFIMLIFDLILVSSIQAMFQLALVNHMISNNYPKKSLIQILFYFLKLQDVLGNINL
ncbi:transmembrane protein, putative (macronuclear) [Tetrahymena thermophila SB210]|uniref:Transmembrane protein, putative n=1 Tax=Tetrahymena thermophila (strain SB210) TaxID=312017 RepID=W7XJN5_TETTS|nr:transmembrane protein, putative [Tetrahymena thermophila SB210]EWS75711.1 transmembrane protein, putative [Tetrahymena thermophila SB210]|eukprot:XP_012651753.1 transmembrane protein, putative [Tetrahymena thermophila SB210]